MLTCFSNVELPNISHRQLQPKNIDTVLGTVVIVILLVADDAF